MVIQNQKNRYKMLLALWREVNGREMVRVNFNEIAKRENISKEEANDIYIYFMGENFFGVRDVGGNVSLSHRAIVEIEESLENPSRGTPHFPATVIQNFNAPVGSVQTGPHSTSNVNQNFGSNTSEVINLLNELRNNLKELPEGQRQEATELTDFIEVEIVSESPNKTKLKAFLKQLGTFTVNTASNVFATAIAKYYGIGS